MLFPAAGSVIIIVIVVIIFALTFIVFFKTFAVFKQMFIFSVIEVKRFILIILSRLIAETFRLINFIILSGSFIFNIILFINTVYMFVIKIINKLFKK